MSSDFQHRLIYLILALPAYVLAFTLHEFAHAYVADQLGDDTPRRAGKFSLDPFKMLDPMGSLFLVITLLMGLPLLGWAYVPINPANFRNPARDHALVAVAGPLSNFVQAFIWLALLFLARIIATQLGFIFDSELILNILNRQPSLGSLWEVASAVCAIGAILNISLGVFNLLPFPPFDGGVIAEYVLPPLRPLYQAIRPMSFIIIMLLISSGPVLSRLFAPVQSITSAAVLRAFGEDPRDFYYFDSPG